MSYTHLHNYRWRYYVTLALLRRLYAFECLYIEANSGNTQPVVQSARPNTLRSDLILSPVNLFQDPIL
jgi:hypothetical protein